MANDFYPHPFDQLTVELCNSARRYIRILSPDLDHEVFDNDELREAISKLARRSRHTQVRILISDTRALVQRGHRLLELSRRVPNLVHIQVLEKHPEMNDDVMVIRDMDGLLFKPGDSEHQGRFEPDSRAITKDYVEKFDKLWERSVPNAELRRMGL
ncbi:MAG: hypothetical protein IMF06_05290 [Proteobacteria bacterium]|nr:hypothetical protein [Pseudomonadota bacterium]